MKYDKQNIEELARTLFFDKKSDLVKYCNTLSINQSSFALFIAYCERFPWHIGYNHVIYYHDKVPQQLHPSEEEIKALSESKTYSLSGKALKLATKISQLFIDRRYYVGHMFYSPYHKRWHFFYFDQRDMQEYNNHWKCGPHIHLVNYLWPNLNMQEVYLNYQKGFANFPGKVHIRFNLYR
jgi:hypothetical protein